MNDSNPKSPWKLERTLSEITRSLVLFFKGLINLLNRSCSPRTVLIVGFTENQLIEAIATVLFSTFKKQSSIELARIIHVCSPSLSNFYPKL